MVPPNPPLVCVLDTDASTLQETDEALSANGWEIHPFTDPDAFLEYVRNHQPTAAVVDLGGSQARGLQVRARLREVSPVTLVIISLKTHQRARAMLSEKELVKMIGQICEEKSQSNLAQSAVLQPRWGT